MTVDLIVGPRKSFFTWAAMYSFVAPLATAAVSFAIFYGVHFLGGGPLGDGSTNFISLSGLIVVATSLILGVVSLFGIERHGARVILWKALLGILLSCVVGFGIFVLALAAAMGHGC